MNVRQINNNTNLLGLINLTLVLYSLNMLLYMSYITVLSLSVEVYIQIHRPLIEIQEVLPTLPKESQQLSI